MRKDRQAIYDSTALNKSQAEADDLKLLHEAQDEEKDNFSSYCQHILDMDETMLKHSGHKTQEGAVFRAAQDHKKKLLNLVKAHIKKYPD